MSRAITLTRRYRRLIGALLLASFVVALALRMTGIGFGRGVMCPRPDEELMQSGVLNGLRGDLNPHYAVWGHLFHNCYLFLVASWHWIGLGVGRFASWTDAVAASHLDPFELLGCGRGLSAIIGSLTVWIVYSLARDSAGSRMGGVIAALLQSSLFLHVRDSHFATSDIMLAATCTASLAVLARPGPVRAGWAGFWCGLALATKLIAVTVWLTSITCIVLGSCGTAPAVKWAKPRAIVRFTVCAIAMMLFTQPFILLDPMETWYGWFGDLFNPERRPFERGLNLNNASIIVRYYVPQAMGWGLGALSLVGAIYLLTRQLRLHRSVPVVIVYLGWSLVAILSVQRTFLRYLDPLVPAICVVAAVGAMWLGRLAVRALAFLVPVSSGSSGTKEGVAPTNPRTACGRGASNPRENRGSLRLAITYAVAAVALLPNLGRSILLDSRLLRADTRSLAAAWIREHIAAGSRILWLGHGQIESHITMPWLEVTLECDQLHSELRRSRGLSTSIEDAIERLKRERSVPMYRVVGGSIGADRPECSSLERYSMLDHSVPIPILQAADRFARQSGLVRAESTRWDLMRRHIASVWETTVDSIVSSGEQYVVLTGLPCDADLVSALSDAYDEVHAIDPGTPWPELARSVMYDMGDAWYLPNYGIARVDRPGPQIRVFRRR